MQGLDVELNVLGASLEDEDAASTALALLDPNDFLREENRIIWGVMRKLADKGMTPSASNIIEHLRREKLLNAAGGVVYINAITDTLPAMIDMEEQCRFIKDHAMMDRLKKMAQKIEGYTDPSVLLDYVQLELDKILGSHTFDSSAPAAAIADKLIRDALSIHAGESKQEGITTGFTGLDRMFSTIGPGELVLIASRPGVGKSALATNISVHVSTIENKSVLFVSLEMTGSEVVSRIIGAMESVNTRSFKTGNFDTAGVPNDFERVQNAEAKLQKASLIIDDRGSLTIPQLKALARKIKAKSGLHLIVIDYIQLMTGPGATRNEVVGGLSRGLKMLAKDLGVAVIALSQLRRKHMESKDQELHDLDELRESGNLEQDADKVIFIIRDENARKGLFQVAKQRNGPVGFVPVKYVAEFCRFEDGQFGDEEEDSGY